MTVENIYEQYNIHVGRLVHRLPNSLVSTAEVI